MNASDASRGDGFVHVERLARSAIPREALRILMSLLHQSRAKIWIEQRSLHGFRHVFFGVRIEHHCRITRNLGESARRRSNNRDSCVLRIEKRQAKSLSLIHISEPTR